MLQILPMQIPRVISAAVDKVAKQILGKEWGLYSSLLENWREIVGEEYAKVTTPVKVMFQNSRSGEGKHRQENGVLHISLPRGLAMEFSFLTGQILQRVNSFFGYKAIERIIFEHNLQPLVSYDMSEKHVLQKDSLSPQETAMFSALDDLGDGDLAESLKNLGKAILETEKLLRK